MRSTVLFLLSLSSLALGQKTYQMVGAPNMVLVNEGDTTVAIRENCAPTADMLPDTCIAQVPDYQMCADMCTKQGAACGSFAFCTGKAASAPPPAIARCFLKTAQVDFATIPHGAGDCNTYLQDGSRLDMADAMVARNEGNNLASYKPDCTPEPTDLCFQATPTLDSCNQTCAGNEACNSFAFCTGASEVGFARCYLKTADFATVSHGQKWGFDSDGDCSSYYPTEAGTCGDVKEYYKKQECCGNAAKTLNFNIGQTFR